MEQTTTNSVADRLLVLYRDLCEQEQAKKDSNKAYSEEIKRIKAEIKDLIEDEDATEPAE